jgi:hypothetical protein
MKAPVKRKLTKMPVISKPKQVRQSTLHDLRSRYIGKIVILAVSEIFPNDDEVQECKFHVTDIKRTKLDDVVLVPVVTLECESIPSMSIPCYPISKIHSKLDQTPLNEQRILVRDMSPGMVQEHIRKKSKNKRRMEFNEESNTTLAQPKSANNNEPAHPIHVYSDEDEGDEYFLPWMQNIIDSVIAAQRGVDEDDAPRYTHALFICSTIEENKYCPTNLEELRRISFTFCDVEGDPQ